MAIKLTVEEPTTETHEQSLPTTPGDVFSNLEGRRLRQSFDKLKTKKPLTTVGMRKPKAHEWFQAHPTFRQEWVLFKAEEEGLNEEWFFPANEEVLAVLEELSIKGVKTCMIFWWINRKGNTFVWPVQLADADGRQNEWHASMFDMMSVQANGQWARIEAGGQRLRGDHSGTVRERERTQTGLAGR